MLSGYYEELNTLLQELRSHSPQISHARWGKICAQKDVKIFTHRQGKKIVGMAILRWHDLPVGRVGTVEDVIVLKNQRGKGFGKNLMAEIIQFAKRKKMAYIDLTSRPERLAANMLYQKMGWKKRETNVYRFYISL